MARRRPAASSRRDAARRGPTSTLRPARAFLVRAGALPALAALLGGVRLLATLGLRTLRLLLLGPLLGLLLGPLVLGAL